MRRLIYLVATSLDGYIAGPDGVIDAFPVQGDHIDYLFRELPETLPTPVLAAAGVPATTSTFDTVVMGWGTYDLGFRVGLTSPYAHLRQYVFRRSLGGPASPHDVSITGEPPCDVVRRLKAEPSTRDIWLCGGGRLAAALAPEIDQLVLKVNPILLGAGIRVFESDAYRPRAFRLGASRTFTSGVMMNTYERV
ncbi:MAG TPA: dihydrofolate reductase family protein [Polyangiaceae bacterium]|nr:dihydrofolate reductase family protein [Polyangiaceae bacterium]